MAHATWGLIRFVTICQSDFGPGMLLNIVVFPFNGNSSIESNPVELYKNVLEGVRVPLSSGCNKVPPVSPISHWLVPSKAARPGMFACDPNTLYMGTVNSIAKFPNELNHGNILPFHVGAIQIEARYRAITCLVHCRQVIVGGFDIPHGPFTGVTFQVKSGPVMLASVENGSKSLNQKL